MTFPKDKQGYFKHFLFCDVKETIYKKALQNNNKKKTGRMSLTHADLDSPLFYILNQKKYI